MFRLNYYHGTKSVTMFTYDAMRAEWVVIKSGINSGVKIVESMSRIFIVQVEKDGRALPAGKQRRVQTFPTASTVIFYDHQDGYVPKAPAKKKAAKPRVKTSK